MIWRNGQTNGPWSILQDYLNNGGIPDSYYPFSSNVLYLNSLKTNDSAWSLVSVNTVLLGPRISIGISNVEVKANNNKYLIATRKGFLLRKKFKPEEFVNVPSHSGECFLSERNWTLIRHCTKTIGSRNLTDSGNSTKRMQDEDSANQRNKETKMPHSLPQSMQIISLEPRLRTSLSTIYCLFNSNIMLSQSHCFIRACSNLTCWGMPVRPSLTAFCVARRTPFIWCDRYENGAWLCACLDTRITGIVGDKLDN